VNKTSRVILQFVFILVCIMVSGVWLEEHILANPADNIYAGQNLFVLAHWFDPRVVHHVHTREKLAALTFDDGPDPRYTPEVLDILRQYRVRATFFVIGESVEKYPELVKRALSEGHEVESHSYTHPNLANMSTEEISYEIRMTQEAVRRVTGTEPRYFRPPKGLFNRKVIDAVHEHGLKIVLWDVGVEHGFFKDPRDMAYRVVGRAHPGVIILAHDGRLDRRLTVKALPMLISEYQRMGYRFVTLNELLAASE